MTLSGLLAVSEKDDPVKIPRILVNSAVPAQKAMTWCGVSSSSQSEACYSPTLMTTHFQYRHQVAWCSFDNVTKVCPRFDTWMTMVGTSMFTKATMIVGMSEEPSDLALGFSLSQRARAGIRVDKLSRETRPTRAPIGWQEVSLYQDHMARGIPESR